ncbi:hypothetical protein [Methylocaldum sp. GT1TLB]|uniref:hypothetical protein n=1 Tax=Methylocaldum sp. GT1TLB TaxID=3438965 RepID=UPI003DA0ACDF
MSVKPLSVQVSPVFSAEGSTGNKPRRELSRRCGINASSTPMPNTGSQAAFARNTAGRNTRAALFSESIFIECLSVRCNNPPGRAACAVGSFDRRAETASAR